MTSPIGSSSPNRPFSPVSDTRGPVQASSVTSPTPSESHVSDPAQTERLRQDIYEQAWRNPSLYALEVGVVNEALRRTEFGISPASHQSVTHNLRQVHAGTMTEAEAHFREAGSFAQDAFQSLQHGQYGQGAMEAFGAAINAEAGILTAPSAVGQQLGDAIRREISSWFRG